MCSEIGLAAAHPGKKQESNEKHKQTNRNSTDQDCTAFNSKSFRIGKGLRFRGLDEMRERTEPRRDKMDHLARPRAGYVTFPRLNDSCQLAPMRQLLHCSCQRISEARF
jgi:hypothetical protein